MRKRVTKSAGYKDAFRIMQTPNGDVEKAARLLIKALAQGDPFAAYALGTWHFYGSNGFKKNQKKGIELWNIAAAAKVPDALFDLAVCYEEGEHVEKNLRRAFLLYLDSAIRGDKEAIFEVGRCYFFGIGISKNMKIADVWFDRAEELGTYNACARLTRPGN